MRGEVAQTMYTHVSKCKNDKIKGEKKKKGTIPLFLVRIVSLPSAQVP
jgi:hypothetical protein